MADRYRYTGAQHVSESGDVVKQGEEYEPSERDLKDKSDLWEPVGSTAQAQGADIGLRALPMTDRALEIALEAGLDESDFEGVEPEGADGDYLVRQVRDLVEDG